MPNQEARAATEAEKLQAQRRAAVEQETKAMSTAFAALQLLDDNGRRRAMRWLGEALDNIEVPF